MRLFDTYGKALVSIEDKVFKARVASYMDIKLKDEIARLQGEYVAAGKAALFEELKIFLTGEKRAVAYAELAANLGTTEAALKMTVSRMRHRYGELLRTEIAQTVAGPEEIEDELRALFAALSG